ncbi:erythromycin esterase family protein [Dactylosporangium sp. AC04546]|uniref:erythromycin esterase family protein n=1 Tax=Dactylosporangium sp. AC04546 TaxID=2862460 RepID=UPI001EE0FB65|nr:erythromycin esterase family protein [Dactylosporangium sp. AC04546]WVK78187.1 erythromycin esterase family protein [Dactylosporangium sp. AC04546]
MTPLPIDATTVLSLLPSPHPRVLGLGEPTHGEDILLEVRNDLFRQLIDQAGYRTVAIESDCLLALTVDDYVTGGPGTLDDAMTRGFSHSFGASPANRALVQWMRDTNQTRPPADRVRFAGIDGPLEISGPESPRTAVTTVHTYLTAHLDPQLLPCTTETLASLLGPDERWTNPATMFDPAESIGRTPNARELRLIADDLANLVDAETPHLIAATGRDAWDRARLHARTATGLLRYHYWMADPSPARLNHLVRVRDTMMADNVLALAERGPTLLFAHNSHLQRERSSMRMGDLPLQWWSAGALSAARLGTGYAFLATALGTIRHQGVGTPPPDTVEGHLYATGEDRFLVDPRTLAATFTAGPPAPRGSEWFGYAGLDPAHLTGTDGIVYVRDCPAPN